MDDGRWETAFFPWSVVRRPRSFQTRSKPDQNVGHLRHLSSGGERRETGEGRRKSGFWFFFLLLTSCVSLVSCNTGLGPGIPDGTGIKGALIFTGTWPENTADVAVAVYRTRPQTLADFFNIAGWDTTVAIGATRYEYFVPLEMPGIYEWIVVAWRPEGGFWDFNSLLGCYHAGGALPLPIEVVAGESAKNIDIYAHFALLSGADLPDRQICSGFLPALPALPKSAVGNSADR